MLDALKTGSENAENVDQDAVSPDLKDAVNHPPDSLTYR